MLRASPRHMQYCVQELKNQLVSTEHLSNTYVYSVTSAFENSVLAELGSSIQNSTPTSIFPVDKYITYVRKHVHEEMTVSHIKYKI